MPFCVVAQVDRAGHIGADVVHGDLIVRRLLRLDAVAAVAADDVGGGSADRVAVGEGRYQDAVLQIAAVEGAGGVGAEIVALDLVLAHALRKMPLPWLPEMTLRSSDVEPPMVSPLEPISSMPLPPLAATVEPSRASPI